MTKNAKKRIVWIILLLVVIAASVGYYLYNKGPRDVKDSKGTAIAASTLYTSFLKDSTGSLAEYSDKILEVSGQVQSIAVNQQKQKVILLKTNSEGGYINCTMEENTEDFPANSSLTIKGICSGMGQGDADLGIMGDVYLTRCYLIKNN